MWDVGSHAYAVSVSVVGFGQKCVAILKGELAGALLRADEERLLVKILWAVLWLLITSGVHEPELVAHLEEARLRRPDRIRIITVKRL